MASPPDEPAAEAGAGAISKVLVVIAMQTEALPLVNKFQLVEAPTHESVFPKGAPWIRFHGNYKGLHIDLVWPGKDRVLGIDSIGTVSAALVTYASIQALKPDLIINAGTAGGFKAKGAGIGDVFLASDVAFHDRRIPIPVFDMYGIGARKTFATPIILKELNLKVGKLSTGDSLDMSPQDESAILNNDATVKDMEGAAVAYVADMFSTPAIFVKAVTDIVDGEKPTAEEFLQNLVAVTAALDQAVTKVVDFISGKCISAPPKRHHSIPDIYLARNQLATPVTAQGLAFPPLHGPVPFQLQPSPPPPRGAMKTTAAEAAQQQLLDELAGAAKAAEAGNSIGAREILARLNHQLPPLGKPFLRSASYLKEALLLALADGYYGASRLTSPFDVALKLAAYKSFSDLSPVMQFANFTATQALLDEIAGSAASCIHVIDFDLGVGGQWASFLQELAHRHGAGCATMPLLKLTAFVSSASHHPLELHLTQDNLSQFAADLGIPFEFNAVSLDTGSPADLIFPTGDEVVAVSLPVGCSARAPPLPVILRLVKQLNPKIVVAMDYGGDRADLPFWQHFLNCFQSCVFLLDSLDAAGIDADSACKIERFLIQPRIEDAVLGRRKADKAMSWRNVFAATGFTPVPLSNLAEAQADCLLKRVQVRGFHLEKREVGLTLYWQRGELVSISAWRC